MAIDDAITWAPVASTEGPRCGGWHRRIDREWCSLAPSRGRAHSREEDAMKPVGLLVDDLKQLTAAGPVPFVER